MGLNWLNIFMGPVSIIDYSKMAKINKLVIKGFKSFQRKTAIPFFPGMTAVVGENGTGKSNIIDAISFVLGRRSSKLRAERMEKLIFNGGKGRKPAEHAHVTLHLDNPDGMFNDLLEEEEDPDEILIGRKVTRSSSTYKFMGHNCPRSKIDDVLNKANIDPSGHHLVRQGKVTKLIKMTPTERREIIDEVSGITSYEEKRERTNEELADAESKLRENEVLLKEKKEVLEKLEKEKEIAEQYRELEARKERLEKLILKAKRDKLTEKLEELEEKREEIDKEISNLEASLESIDEEIEEEEEELEEIEDEIYESKDLSLTKEIEHVRNKIERKKDKIDSKRQQIENLKDSIEEIKQIRSNSRGYKRAVKALLKLDDDNVYGTIQDLMSVDDRYWTAVQTAIGSHLTDVVVEDRDTAIKCINYLKENNKGRARVLPLTKLKTYKKSSSASKACKKPGVIDFAINLVDYDQQYAAAFKYVFRDTIISEDLEAVKELSNVRAVTLDGDLMSKGGAMTGGSKKSRGKKKQKNYSTKEKEDRVEELEQEVKELKKEVGELNEVLEEKKEEEEEKSQTSDSLKNKRKEKKQEIKDLRQERQETYGEAEKKKRKLSRVEDKLEVKQEELTTVKGEIEEELDGDLEDLEQEIEEEEIKVEKEPKTTASPDKLKQQKKSTIRKINSLGPVNMRAPEEYEELKGEYEEFESKVSELQSERQEIKQLIEEIENEKETRFLNTMDKVSEEFGDIFNTLFGGGSGQMRLEEENNIDSGLEIKVEPPKKDPHTIDALSGGEKTLTAIAFIFALQEVRSPPFYIMDEIDAALDKSNSKKLSDFLREYAEDNQLIMVSHNEETVRHADRVYGVSMREGVSKIRSINL